MAAVAIIGGGVIGLTTGNHLVKQGFTVTIFSKDLTSATTSNKAAAIWFPYQAFPWHKVAAWSRTSLSYYQELAEIPNSGVSWVNLWVMDRPQDALTWQTALSSDSYSEIEVSQLPHGYDHGYVVNVPMLDTSIYLPFLLTKFKLHGKFFIRHIKKLDDLYKDFDWVINCTGLAATELVEDSELFPIRGQIEKVKPQDNIRYMADDHGPNALAYVIPRQDCIILGGTAQPYSDNLNPDTRESEDIIHRCQNLEPGLKVDRIETIVGLRPGRSEVRLERDAQIPNVVHNYGHGGSGFTVAWGCAEEVSSIICGLK